MALVYDQETSGLDHYFGQIFQLGVSVCDDHFNITEEFDLRARRLPWVIPSPSAMLITKIDTNRIETGASCFEMMRRFNEIARTQSFPVKTLGYNIINFDDPGLQIAFDQNLLQAKFTTEKNPDGTRNQRNDLLIMMQALLIHQPAAMTLDIKTKNGAPALKLGVVCRQNGIDLSEDAAHEALADNHGTIGIAKLIRSKYQPFWDHMMELTTEEGVARILKNHDILHVSKYNFGRASNKIIAHITDNPEYPAEHVAFDLSYDPEPYLNMDIDQLLSTMKLKKKNPFVFIRPNKMPILMPLNMVDGSVLPANLDEGVLKSRQQAIRDHGTFLQAVQKAASRKNEIYGLSPYIEKQVFHRFSEQGMEAIVQWRKQFYHADWKERGELVQSFSAALEKELSMEPALIRFKQFGQRILYDNKPELLPDSDREYLEAAIANRVLSQSPKSPQGITTIHRAINELQEIEQKFAAGKIDYLAQDEGGRISDLEKYYRKLGDFYQARNGGHPMIGLSKI
ncbi:MAG: hypothetical protein ACK4VI_04210 [Alphaproteobacteria bacterium]